MSPVRSLARPLLAAAFVADGAGGLRSPAARVAAARAAGLTDPERLVRANAAARLVGGLALATGRAPRLASLVLAAGVLPTAVVRHPFWSARGADRTAHRQAFVVDLSLLGGLLVSAADTGGRESLPHAAGRLSRRTARRAAKAARQAQAHLPG